MPVWLLRMHLPVLMPGDSAPSSAPRLCESAGETELLHALGPDPRLVGLVSPVGVVEALWSEISPTARAAFDMIDADGSGAIDTDEVRRPIAELSVLLLRKTYAIATDLRPP
jgi:hypothetical protein